MLMVRTSTRETMVTATPALRGTISRWDAAILPRHRLNGAAFATALLAIFDSAATNLWLHTGIATEGNPLVADVLATHGASTGLALRGLVAVALVLVLWAIARQRWEARGGLIIGMGALSLVAGFHVVVGVPALAAQVAAVGAL